MTVSRRQTLRILAASIAVPMGLVNLHHLRGQARPIRWQGEALGALSAMTLWDTDPARARRALLRMQVEIARLEAIFSLYQPASELSRLNQMARLDRPSRDLLFVLEHAQVVADRSGGAFDPTIQPLWVLHSRDAGSRAHQLETSLALVDYTRVTATPRAIQLGGAGMAVSLNGVAQGYITDRITEMLGNEGYENAVIELGETRALGTAPDGHPFEIGIIDPLRPSSLMEPVALANSALSVSGGYGQSLPDGSGHHIFDPHTGQSAVRLLQVAVIAPKAMEADALSTAIYVAGEPAAPSLLAGVTGARAILTRRDGSSLLV